MSYQTSVGGDASVLRVYADHGVGFVWFVEPLEKLVEVLELDGPTYRIIDTAEGDAAARLKPFDAIEFPLGALWQRWFGRLRAPRASAPPQRVVPPNCS